MTRARVRSYAIAFAHSSGVVDVSGPGESKRAAVEVAVREHVRQAERVVVVLGEQLKERLHTVVAREPLYTMNALVIITIVAPRHGVGDFSSGQRYRGQLPLAT